MHGNIQLVIAGLAGGALTALLALGLIVQYRSSSVLNLGHGAVAMIAALFFLNAVGKWDWPVALAFPVAILISTAVSSAFQYVVVRSLRDSPTLARLVSTLGLMLLLTSCAGLIYGYGLQPSARILPSGTYSLPFGDPPYVIGIDRLWYIVVALALTVAMWALYRYTSFGRATRAAADSPRATELLGYSPQRLELINWALGGALAGIAGVLIATITPPDIYSYNALLLVAIAVALLARFQSFAIMFVAALVISSAQAVLLRYGPDLESLTHLAGWGSALPLLVIIGVVLLRGTGLASKGQRLEKSLPDVPVARNLHLWLPALAVVGVIWVFVAPSARVVDATNGTLILTLVAMSLVLLTGYAGQVSLAQLTIAGFGGWSAAKVAGNAGLPFPLPVIVAAIAAGLIALLVGAPALRLRGLNLAVVTLGFAMVMDIMFFSNREIAGADSGLPLPPASLFGIDLNGITSPRSYGIFLIVVNLLVVLGMVYLRRSQLGEQMLAIRANERGAAALGISVSRTKMVAFGISGCIAGLAGSLQGYRSLHLSWPLFDFNQSILIVAFAYLGGITLLSGALVTGILMNGGLLPELLRAQGTAGQIVTLVGAIGVIGMVLKHPSGLAGIGGDLRHFRSRRRAASELEQGSHATRGGPDDAREPVPARAEEGAGSR